MSFTKCSINISVTVLELPCLSPQKCDVTWHFGLGLDAEGVGKLSRNKLSHAEAPCLVA